VGTRFTLAGLVCAVLLIPLASASASTTVGSSLVFDGTGAALADCDPLCTFIPTDVAIVGSGPVTSPIDGIVVRWGTSAADPSGSVCTADPMECTSTVRLRVIASPAPNHWVGAGTGPVEHIAAAFQNSFFAVTPGMPIAGGEYIGVDTVRDGGDMHGSTLRGVLGSSSVNFNTTLPDSGSPQAAAPSSGLEAYVQATVEPDADRDRFGDETQDQCPGSAGSQNGCPPAQPSTHARKKCKKKHKKRPHVAKKKCKRKHRK
jgi:hypothetical protein